MRYEDGWIIRTNLLRKTGLGGCWKRRRKERKANEMNDAGATGGGCSKLFFFIRLSWKSFQYVTWDVNNNFTWVPHFNRNRQLLVIATPGRLCLCVYCVVQKKNEEEKYRRTMNGMNGCVVKMGKNKSWIPNYGTLKNSNWNITVLGIKTQFFRIIISKKKS